MGSVGAGQWSRGHSESSRQLKTAAIMKKINEKHVNKTDNIVYTINTKN